MSRKTALVTGASGMIGSHVVDYLVDEKKMFVVALDPAPPFWISRHILNDDAVYIHGSSFDVAQVNKIRREFDVDVIFDIGALLGSEECMPRLDTAITMTTLGARNIAELALDAGAKVFYILTEFSTELYRDFTDGYCYDERTEILTNKGWKRFTELKGDELVLQRREDGKAEFVKPSLIYVSEYDGDVYELKTERHSFCVTPGHKMFCKSSIRQRNFSLRPVEDICRWRRAFVSAKVDWEGREQEYFELPEVVTVWGARNSKILSHLWRAEARKIKMDDWLCFLGWFLSEGCVENERYVSITQKKYVDEVRECLQKCGFAFSERLNKKKGAVQFRICSRQLAKWLIDNCYVSGGVYCAKTKKLPEFVKDLAPRQLNILLDAFVRGDGYMKNGRRRIVTYSKELANGLHEIMLKAGKTAVVRETSNGGFLVMERREGIEINTRRIEKKRHCGLIGCVEVPSHVIMVRRDGFPMWSGNTITKNAAADVYREYKKQNPDLDLCFARVHHVFSPRQKLLPVRKLLPTAIAYAVTGSTFKIFGEATANKRVDYIHGDDAAKVIVECTLHGDWLETPLFDIGGCDENFLSVKEVVESVIDVVGDGSYEIIEDFRKQPATSTKATNNWKEYVQPFEMKRFKDELPNIVDAFLDRYSLEDFKLAVKVFEDRLRWGV